MEKNKILLKFEIIDSGIGISEKYIHAIFDKYTQIEEFDKKSTIKGTGLGLAIVKKLIETMGGEISVTSKEGIGTKFIFTLPFDIEEGGQKLKLTHYNTGKAKDSVSILVAEDDEINKIIIAAFLKSQGWSFIAVENGKEALVELTKNKYDLILMDIHMPVLNGIETIKEINKNKEWHSIPKIALTANTLDEYKENLEILGFDAYLSKPIEEKDFILTLKKALKLPLAQNLVSKKIRNQNNIEAGFKRIEKIVHGDVALVIELAEKVATIFSNENLMLLEKNIYEHNISEVQEFVHKTKGAILNFQLNEVVSLLDELVQSLTSDDKNEPKKIVLKIKQRMIPFKEKIKDYVKSSTQIT